MQEEKKITRRNYLRYAGAGAVAVAAAAAGAYYFGQSPPSPPTTTETISATTETIPTTPTGKPMSKVLATATNGLRKLNLPKGTTLNLLCMAGLNANGYMAAREKFYEISGFTREDIDVEISEVPESEYDSKALAEAATQSGTFDYLAGSYTWGIIDQSQAGIARPIDDFIAKYDPDIGSYIWPLTYLTKVAGKTYGLPMDGDIVFNIYRKDLLQNPEEKDSFKSQYGYELKWPEVFDKDFVDVLEFFTRKKGEKLAGETLGDNFYGAVEWRSRAYTNEWFWARFMCLAQDKEPAYYFDEETMEPTFNNETGAKALTDLVAMNKYMHPDIVSWGYDEQMTTYVSGNAFTFNTWPNICKQAEDPERSKIVGKSGYGLSPGYMVNGKLSRRILGEGTYFSCVNSWGKNPELAYLYALAMSSPELSVELITYPMSNADPFRREHFSDPKIVNQWPAAKDYLKADQECFKYYGPLCVMPGWLEYYDKLELEIQAFQTGAKTAEKALRDAETEWNKVTDRRGRDEQKRWYKAWVETWVEALKYRPT